MRWMHRNRTLVAVMTLIATLLTHVAPVAAWYDPKTGRFLQRDPHGTALLVTDPLSHSARNPTVHVWLTPELQFGDGMNFYQYVMSNPVNYTDPTGLFSLGPFGDVFSKWAPSLLELATFGGYFMGLRYAHMHGGFGPASIKGSLSLAWAKADFFPTNKLSGWANWAVFAFLPGTTGLLEKHGDLSILGKRVAGAVRNINRVSNMMSKVGSGPVAALASPFLASGAAYVGIIDAVLWTVENDF